jgi:membrane protease YdiL (CAAX protease family)
VTVLASFFTVRSLTAENLIIQNIEFYGVLLVFLIAFVALKEKRRSLREIFSSMGLKPDGTAKSLLWTFALFPLFAVIGLTSMLLSNLFISTAASSSGPSSIPSWYFGYVIVQAFFPVAVVEEMVGRGYMLDRLIPEHPSSIAKATPAILLSALLFTVYHIPTYLAGYHFSIPQTAIALTINVFPNTIVLSIAYVRSKTRNILGPILIHFLLDAIPIILAIALTKT